MAVAREKIQEKIASVLNIPVSKVVPEAILTELVMESFILIEMVIELQDAFNVRFNQADLKEVQTVEQLYRLMESRIT